MSQADLALAKRYGQHTVQSDMDRPWNEMIALQMRHRSVRAFAETPLPAGLVEVLVAAGQSAATSSNMQTTTVIAVRDKARLARIAALCRNQPFIAHAPLLLCFVADLSRPARIGAALDIPLPALDLLDTYVTAATECGIFGQNVALAAESLGLGICYLGNLKQEPERIAQELRLPASAIVLFGMCIGYEDPARVTGIRPRLPQSIILKHEIYEDADEARHLCDYDRVFTAHEVGQRRAPVPWSARHHDRFADPAYLGNRKRMKAALRRMGFKLR